MNRILLFVVAVAALCLSPRHCADAGCRHIAVVQKQAAVAYAPVQQPYYWAVGQSLQDDARAERIANLVIQKLQAQQQTAPETLPLTAEVDRWALVKANCQSCHTTNQKAMEAVDMTDLEALSCEQKLACIAAVLDGKMPKGKKLDPQTLGNLLGEFSGAETAHTP